jgi:hypothetical protein
MAKKGQKMYASTPTNCLCCKVLIPVGVRRPNQTLCLASKEERKDNPVKLSRCQVTYYNDKKQAKKKALNFIICDQCHKKIQPEDPLQVRCVSGIEGVDSDCQTKAKKLASQKFHAKKQAKNKICLKCNNKFESDGEFNRVCDPCNLVNDREARKEHRIAVT